MFQKLYGCWKQSWDSRQVGRAHAQTTCEKPKAAAHSHCKAAGPQPLQMGFEVDRFGPCSKGGLGPLVQPQAGCSPIHSCAYTPRVAVFQSLLARPHLTTTYMSCCSIEWIQNQHGTVMILIYPKWFETLCVLLNHLYIYDRNPETENPCCLRYLAIMFP